MIVGIAVDREHAAGFPDTHDLFTGQRVMDISGKRRDISDLSDMIFLVQHRLIEVGDRPALRDIETEELRQFFRGLRRDRIPPGPEFAQLFVILIERQITVHHRGDPDRAGRIERHAILFTDFLLQIRETGLQTGLYFIQRVRPDSVNIAVFPHEGT